MRRTGRIRRACLWAVTCAFLLTTVLWGVSYILALECFLPVETIDPGVFPAGLPEGGGPLRIYILDSGLLIINFPSARVPPLEEFVWQVVKPFGNPFVLRLGAITGLSGIGPLGIIFRPLWLPYFIPLWLPFLSFGIPTFLLWRPRIRRWRQLKQAGRVKTVRERFGRLPSLIISILVGFLALILIVITMEFHSVTPESLREAVHDWLVVPDTCFLVLLLFVWMFLAYGVARLAHHWARWKTVYIDPPLCERCGYNLTQNTSGRCPECGTTINTDTVILFAPDRETVTEASK